MSKTNHRRGFVGDSRGSQRSKKRKPTRYHQKNPTLGGRSLTGSVHAADYPPEGFNSRIRQRENKATKRLASEVEDGLVD